VVLFAASGDQVAGTWRAELCADIGGGIRLAKKRGDTRQLSADCINVTACDDSEARVIADGSVLAASCATERVKPECVVPDSGDVTRKHVTECVI